MPRKGRYAIPEEEKDMLGGAIQTMLEWGIETRIDEREAANPAYGDSRNG